MRVELKVGGLIAVPGHDIALGRTHALLDAVDAAGSVSRAAERLGLSYRTAWGRLSELEAAFGHPLVVKTKGHGSALTERGAALRDALGATLRAFEGSLAAEGEALRHRLAAVLAGGPGPRPVRLAISHDPLLLDALGGVEGVAAEVIGSGEAVERLLAGGADAAGFHAGTDGVPEYPPFSALRRADAFTVRALFRREQGLLVARGNPLGLRGVVDLARAGVRFVNRQRGSGTRLWFDRLLAGAGVVPGAVAGYGTEEFTHQAVAALVASGAADAGMGVRAAADRFGLGFVRVGAETYFLASRTPAAHTEALERVTAAVLARVERSVGYARAGDAAGAGAARGA